MKTASQLKVTIENPKGSMRHGKDWSQKMAHDYGFINDTVGADGDALDCFCGPNEDADTFYVVEQCNAAGDFDEHKIMLGFSNMLEAKEAYMANYPEGWDGLKNISEKDVEDFWDWYNGNSSSKKENAMSVYKFRQGTGLMERGSDRYGSVNNGAECTDCGGGGKYGIGNCKTCGGSGKKNEKKNAAGVFKKGDHVIDHEGKKCLIVGEASSGEYYVVEYPDSTQARMREGDLEKG